MMPHEEDKLQEEIFNNIFDHMLFLLNDSKNESINQLVASSMLAIAIRLYKTALTEEDYKEFTKTLLETAKKAKPFDPQDFEIQDDFDNNGTPDVMISDISGAKTFNDVRDIIKANQLKLKNKLN